jgi:hypothetical protein
LTTTEPQNTFDLMMLAINDSLSDIASSYDGRMGKMRMTKR